MSKVKKESFFWTSYSDLMTSLFFVMLVLFVLTVVMLNREALLTSKIKIEYAILKDSLKIMSKTVEVTEAKLEHIERLNKSIENIDPRYFIYDERYKRHTLKDIEVSFRTNSSNIRDIPRQQQKQLISAGKAISRFIDTTIKGIPEAKYLLIIEGQSSKDSYQRNNELSYSRALSLVNLWRRNGVRFNNETCEVIISGSGQNSSFRLLPDNAWNSKNQRFVIHIIPKPGIIE